jgi:aryl-alcohol dehydrogenase-like predicted oxidoreductase
MRYKLLGKSGLRVSELALGTMTFGEDWGWGASKEESRRMFDAFVKAGGNFIDTANRYTNGSSEKFVGEFVSADREQFVIATKYTLSTRPDDPNAGGNHRKNMVQSINKSLKQLSMDYIDLYWIHAWDMITPVEEIMRGLDDLVRAGKVLYIGISDAPAWWVARANTLAELQGWSQFVGLQIPYSLIERTVERELLRMAQALDIGVAAWSPLAAGLLSGKYNADPSTPGRATQWGGISERNLAIAKEVVALASEIGRTPSQVALNWVRQQPGTIIPIIGARTVAQFEEDLACLEFRLSAEQLQRLSDASKIDVGFPYSFIATPENVERFLGTSFKQIDLPGFRFG